MHKIVLAALTAALAAPALALNMNVFREAPVSRLNSAEVKEFKAFVERTLDEGTDGATVEWKAPKTNFTSRITVGKGFEDGKLKCREATIDSDSHDRQMKGRYTFCKPEKGEWRFKIPDRKSK
jgi:surface antigen